MKTRQALLLFTMAAAAAVCGTAREVDGQDTAGFCLGRPINIYVEDMTMRKALGKVLQNVYEIDSVLRSAKVDGRDALYGGFTFSRREEAWIMSCGDPSKPVATVPVVRHRSGCELGQDTAWAVRIAVLERERERRQVCRSSAPRVGALHSTQLKSGD